MSITRREVGFSLLAVLLFFGGLEAVARIYYHWRHSDWKNWRGETDSGVLIVSDPILNHKWNPRLDKIDESRSIPYHLKANSMGWIEEREIPVAKPAGTFRIFELGDSNTQGVVGKEFKMVRLLEQKLNSLPRTMDFDSINLGTSAYSPVFFLMQVRHQILDYSPDLVIINLAYKAITYDWVYHDLVTFDSDGIPDRISPTPREVQRKFRITPDGRVELDALEKLKDQLQYGSAFFRILDATLFRLAPGRDVKNVDPLVEKIDLHARPWSEETRKAAAFTAANLAATLDILRSHGIPAVVSMITTIDNLKRGSMDDVRKIYRDVTLEHGGLFLDTSEFLPPDPTPLYWKEDTTHYNQAGNRFLTDTKADFLIRNRARLKLPLR